MFEIITGREPEIDISLDARGITPLGNETLINASDDIERTLLTCAEDFSRGKRDCHMLPVSLTDRELLELQNNLREMSDIRWTDDTKSKKSPDQTRDMIMIVVSRKPTSKRPDPPNGGAIQNVKADYIISIGPLENVMTFVSAESFICSVSMRRLMQIPAEIRRMAAAEAMDVLDEQENPFPESGTNSHDDDNAEWREDEDCSIEGVSPFNR